MRVFICCLDKIINLIQFCKNTYHNVLKKQLKIVDYNSQQVFCNNGEDNILIKRIELMKFVDIKYKYENLVDYRRNDFSYCKVSGLCELYHRCKKNKQCILKMLNDEELDKLKKDIDNRYK